MLPVRYAVDNAATDVEVLRRLSAFLEYLSSCHVDSVLPRRFSQLSAASGTAVRDWAQKLSERGHHDYLLGAAGRCWLEEVREAFAAAVRRLDQIEAGGREADAVRGPAGAGGGASPAAH